MMRNGKYVMIPALSLALMLGCFGSYAAAQQPGSIGYAVKAILPDNQVNDQASYFDLSVKPGQEQILQLVVMNREDEEIEVMLEANTALSNRNGVIEYTKSEGRDESMAVDFSEIVKPVESVITVPPHGEAVAEFELKVPDEPFEGIVLGGFVITKLNQNNPDEAQGEMMINNVYQYVLGVRLRESDAAVEPAFQLTGAETGQLAGNPTLILHLRNPQPLLARGIALQASVYPHDSDTAAVTFARNNIAMAPNTSMSYTLYFDDGISLDAGEYRVSVELLYQDRSWQFEMPLIVN